MTRTGRAAVVAACAAALAGAGCGEDQEFIDDYNAAMKPLQDVQRQIAGTSPDARNAAQSYRRLADETSKVNANLAKLEAPADARSDFGRLREALRKSERTFRELAQATEEDDIANLTSAQQELAMDAQAIDRAENAVKRKVED